VKGTEAKAVTVLMRPDCANGRRAAERVRLLASQEGVSVRIDEIVVTTEAQAVELRCPGSPTIRIGGLNVEPAARDSKAYAST
jgi:hypothetical protein